MINDIKLGFKLMKHGLSFKSSIISSVLFLIAGLVFEAGGDLMGIMGSVYAVMGSIMVYQLVQSLTCAGLTQSSPLKKRLQTSISALCTFVCTVILNTIIIGVKLLIGHLNDVPMNEVTASILVSSFFLIVVMVYMGTAMKAFLLSTIVFIMSCGIVGYFIGMGLGLNWFASWNISIGVSIVCSYLAVVIGSFLMYLISLVFYKKDYSRTTFESALKRAK